MITKLYRASGRVSDWVGNNAGVVITFVLGQGIAALIFLTLLAGRVSTIETRGSPEVVMLERRISLIESHDNDQQRQMGGFDIFTNKITALDVRLTAVEVKQNNVIDGLRANASKLDHAIDILTTHLARETEPLPRNKK